ncbi:MAG: hypothetical protein K2X99_03035 [Gemmatimonadaceae bacterium]|nr:hypothetical protein [Gemmatimonadaceae bacterium]
MYRDDIERLICILAAAGFEVTIGDSKFAYDSLDEAVHRAGPTPSELGIRGSKENPRCSIALSFKKRTWSIYASDAIAFAPARECEAILRSRQSRIAHFPIFGMGAIGTTVLYAGAAFSRSSASTAMHVSSTGALLFLASLLLGLYYWMYARAVLQFQHQAGFIRRNRDQLILLVLGVIVGAIVTWASGNAARKP